MKKNEVYTELSIQIGVLEAKVDKILQLLLEQQKPYIINSDFVNVDEVFDAERVYLTSIDQINFRQLVFLMTKPFVRSLNNVP